MTTPDLPVLADLATFARIEVEARDVEPWADLLRALHVNGDLGVEDVHWAVKLYNAFDSLGSAWGAAARWPSPAAWRDATDRSSVGEFACTQERRNLRGGKVAIHLDSYAAVLGPQTQDRWVRGGLVTGTPELDFLCLLERMRGIWGVGRQTAFEWAEFVEKVLDLPVRAADAQLWESSGPRRSLQRLYGNPDPDAQWLNDRAAECRDFLAQEGIALSWEDFETIICDFNVARDGRYYPGRHLAALREEINDAPSSARDALERAWVAVVPEAWQDIAPGIDKAKLPVYRDTGKIIDRP